MRRALGAGPDCGGGREGLPARLLVAYYGLVEAAHAGALIHGGLRLLRTGTVGFPAPPPPGGWAGELTPFFVAMGGIDAINVLLAWLFVYAFFAGARWRWSIGCVTLTASVYSAAVFAGGTMASGAWSHQPAGYLSLAAAFAPVGVLAALPLIWAVRGRLSSG